MAKELWDKDLTIKTPWGFSVVQAIEALKFKSEVEADRSPFNERNPDRGKLNLVTMFGSKYACKYSICQEPNRTKSGLCEYHGEKLNVFRKRRREEKEKRAEKFWAEYREWERVEERKERQRANLMLGMRESNYADTLERERQDRELKDLRAERKRELKARPKRVRYTGPPRAGFVYRLYDSEKTLLYAGKTYNVKARLFGKGGHANREWFPEVFAVRVTEYRTEVDALLAEGFAIRRENPKYNRSIPVQKTSRAPRKVSEYWELVSSLG